MQLPTLTTPSLILRPFELSDAPDVQHLAGDWAIADTTLNIPHAHLECVSPDSRLCALFSPQSSFGTGYAEIAHAV